MCWVYGVCSVCEKNSGIVHVRTTALENAMDPAAKNAGMKGFKRCLYQKNS
jgi:hypothetical protein